MDFFTHLLIGIVVARLFFKDTNKQKAIILGAILPDFDVLLAWIPTIIPSAFILSHRGLFHSIITLLFVFPIIVVLLSRLSNFKKLQSYKKEFNIQLTMGSYIFTSLLRFVKSSRSCTIFSFIRYTIFVFNHEFYRAISKYTSCIGHTGNYF